MGVAFDRAQLLAAFDTLGAAAVDAGVHLDLAVYGGSALMLASNFRFASEDVDVAALATLWPAWLEDAVRRIAAANGWPDDWFNDAVHVHLSPLADRAADHVEFGSFPRTGGPPGLRVFVPTAEYLLALKLKAMRVTDPAKGEQEARDVMNLVRVLGLATPDAAIAVLGRYFPRTAADPAKQRFLLKHIWTLDTGDADAPAYPVRRG